SFPYGPMFTQPLGWFKKQITKADDFKGLKYRTVGISIDVFQGMGAAVNALPGAEIVPAIDRGLLDAAEFNNATSDRLLGFADVSKICMLPRYQSHYTHRAAANTATIPTTAPARKRNYPQPKISSGGKAWLQSGVEGRGGRVEGEAKHAAPADARQPTGAGDEREAQGAHAPQDVRVGALAGATAGDDAGIELEAAGEVVREHAELLPGAVGSVVLRGDDREREFALEFGEGLLLSAAAADEVIQGGQRERQGGGDGVVVEVPVIRGEQIELEILGALVLDMLAVDH